MGSREGRPNSRPAAWAVVLDVVKDKPPLCMSAGQWVEYLSGVAAECICNVSEAQHIARTRRVNPCNECTTAFRDSARKLGMCDPDQFKRRAAMEPVKKETEGAKAEACLTCHRDPKAVNNRTSECSHVDCRNRRRTPELDHASHQQARGGFCDAPIHHATGCYRVQPTCKE